MIRRVTMLKRGPCGLRLVEAPGGPVTGAVEVGGGSLAQATLLDAILDGDAQRIDAAPLRSEVDVPVRVVWGRADVVLPPGNALPGVRCAEDAGHVVHLEASGAVVAAGGR